MDFPFSHTEWKQILTVIYQRAATDHPFHILCQRDPHEAIKLVCGKELPPAFKVRFESPKKDEVIIILPPENRHLFIEFSEKELDDMATGMAKVCSNILSNQHRQTIG